MEVHMYCKVFEYKLKNGKKRFAYEIYLGINQITGKKERTTRRGFLTKKEAESDANRLKYEFDKGIMSSTSTMTYQALYDTWISSYKNTVKESTYVKTIQIFRDHILPVFSEKSISKIKSIDCQNFYNTITNKLERGRSVYSYAKKCYQYALVPLRLVQENPFDFIERTNYQRPETDFFENFLELSEMKDLLTAIKEDDTQLWYTFFTLLAFTGLRKSEALALTWKDIDFKNQTLTVNKALIRGVDHKQKLDKPKTNDSYRTILLDSNTVSVLKDWRTNSTIVGIDLIFPSAIGGYIQNTTPEKHLERIIKKYNFKKITPHGFRHSHCSHLFDAGWSIKEVMERLGHKDLKVMMNIYNHVTEFRRKKTMDQFENYVNAK